MFAAECLVHSEFNVLISVANRIRIWGFCSTFRFCCILWN